MSLRICVYEDDKFEQFYPITHLRPVHCMRAGIVPLYRRADRYFKDASLYLGAREHLASLVAAEPTELPVNIVKREKEDDVLFINGRIRNYGDLPRLVSEARLSTIYRNKGQTVAILFQRSIASEVPAMATPLDYVKAYVEHAEEIPDFDTTATLYHHCWEIMGDIDREIRDDFEFLRRDFPTSEQVRLHEGSILVNRDDIFLGTGAEVKPGALIDASHGPVYIGANTRVEPQAAIYGPTYVGPNSVVVAGKVEASSIGHTCRVGGEVEESIFHSYVNKYHAGFIGHSYVGSWVNFGAMTTNSDLKNNYSNIRVTLNGESLDTGSIKVGSFIGDHTKFGIGTLLNTGINIGLCCNLFGGGLIVDKEVGSFQWGNSDGYQDYRFDKAIETARRTAERRDVKLSSSEEQALQIVADGQSPDKGVLRFQPAE